MAGAEKLCERCQREGHVAEEACAQGESAKLLGWEVVPVHAGIEHRLVRENADYALLKKGDALVYALKGFPPLSRDEALLVHETLEEFREKNNGDPEREAIAKTLDAYCRKNRLDLDDDQRSYLLDILFLLIAEFGPLSKLLDDDDLEEITVIGLGRDKPVHAYGRELGWMQTNLVYHDEGVVRNLVNKMSRRIGRRLSMQTPKLNAVLPDGSRLQASIEPVALSGPNATIRKFRKKPFSPRELVERKTISAEALALLSMLLETDCSLLVCGNTSSGKTSTLNALFEFVPRDERIVVVEETPEISLSHGHVIRLNVAESLGIGMPALIVDTLRMRPDRVIVGEIRNEAEVSAFVDTILAGQGKGSYASFHAQSAEEALTRLRKLGVMELDLAGLDAIVVQRRWNRVDTATGRRKELRKVVELCEVVEEKGKVKLNTLFRFNHARQRLERVGTPGKLFAKLFQTFSLEEAELEKELAGRAAAFAGTSMAAELVALA